MRCIRSTPAILATFVGTLLGAASAQPLTIAALAISAATALAASTVHADTFATYNPVGTDTNVSLSGLTLTASSPVTFDYLTSILSPLGDLAATLSLSATETGAVAFGPLALGTFDGSFNIAYTGLTNTVGGITVTTGESLLSGTFLGSVFTGYGSAANLVDSVLGGGLVSFNDSGLISFDPASDQGLSIGMTSLSPAVHVVSGQLTNFTAVSQGIFAADLLSQGGGVPEPATGTMVLMGVGAIGFAIRRRAT